MSDMSLMDKLLDGVDVEWWPLEKVCRFINGRAYKRPELLDQGKYPVLRVGNFFTNDSWYYSDLELESDKYCDNGDLLYAWSASFGPKLWDGGRVIYHYHIWKVVTDAELILKKFLFYLLEWDSKALREEHATGSTMMHVTKGVIEKRLIPIPCPSNSKKSLEIQGEIVRILDTFTELTAELTAELTTELTARKKQYNYYRDQLLRFGDGDVEWKTLAEVTSSIASGRNKARSTEGAFPVYGSTGQIGCTDAAAYSGDALLVARVGANCGRVNAVSGDYDVSDNTLVVRPEGTWNMRFAFHQLTHMNLNQFAVGAGQPLITGSLLKGLRISLPPMARQERIGLILDKFDALTNSISEGLPREIELRQKQYEYYRDLLLSFPKPKEAAV
jgi:type I restriction enzyme S subunit